VSPGGLSNVLKRDEKIKTGVATTRDAHGPTAPRLSLWYNCSQGCLVTSWVSGLKCLEVSSVKRTMSLKINLGRRTSAAKPSAPVRRSVAIAIAVIWLAVCSGLQCPVWGDQPTSRGIIGPSEGPLAGQAIYANSYALLVGINSYPKLSPFSQLHYAVADVTELKRVLAAFYGFPSDHIIVLTDSGATREGLDAALHELTDEKKLTFDDRIFVYFSGHGVTAPTASGGEAGYLVPSDAAIESVPANQRQDVYGSQCLSMQSLWDDLSTCPAKHVLLMVDACFAGILVQERSTGLEPPGIEMASSHRALEVITAGRSCDLAAEVPALGHGVFSAKFIGLLRQYASEKAGYAVGARQVYGDIYGLVANYPLSHELPQMGSFGTDGDFLFIAKPAGGSGAAAESLDPLPGHSPVLNRYMAAGLFSQLLSQIPNTTSSAPRMQLASDTGPFPDVPTDSDYYQSVEKIRDAGLISGESDGCFHGRQLMPRYEFAAALSRILNALYPTPPEPAAHSMPADVPTDSWMYKIVLRVLDSGAMTLDSNDRFLGGDSMSVEDAIVILKSVAAAHGDQNVQLSISPAWRYD